MLEFCTSRMLAQEEGPRSSIVQELNSLSLSFLRGFFLLSHSSVVVIQLLAQDAVVN